MALIALASAAAAGGCISPRASRRVPFRRQPRCTTRSALRCPAYTPA